MRTLEVGKEYNAAAWGSHSAALLACVSATVGTVLEIGVGHFSTPILHMICAEQERTLFSVEKDEAWHRMFAEIFANQTHLFFKTVDEIAQARFSVVLIDDSPGGENRANHFKRFIEESVFVVVHDYHGDNEEHIGPLLNGLNTHICHLYQPPTLVASRFQLPKSVTIL